MTKNDEKGVILGQKRPIFGVQLGEKRIWRLLLGHFLVGLCVFEIDHKV